MARKTKITRMAYAGELEVGDRIIHASQSPNTGAITVAILTITRIAVQFDGKYRIDADYAIGSKEYGGKFTLFVNRLDSFPKL